MSFFDFHNFAFTAPLNTYSNVNKGRSKPKKLRCGFQIHMVAVQVQSKTAYEKNRTYENCISDGHEIYLLEAGKNSEWP